MKKLLIKCFILIFLPLLFINCSKNLPATQKDTLFLALSSEPRTLDPRFATDANGMRISELIFQSLVKIGPDLKIIGDAAKSWSYKNLKYNFILKKNLSFTNGRKLLPEDIEYSFDEYTKKQSPFVNAFKQIKNVEVSLKDGHYHVSVYLNKFSATFLSSDLPVLKILPKKETILLAKNFASKPLGSGLFVFKSQSSNNVILETRPDNSQISFKTVVFKIIRDDFTRFQKMLNGEIDIAQSEIPRSKIKAIEKQANKFFVYKYPGLAMSYILLNLKDPNIKDHDFRKALAYGLRREEIIRYKLEGLADIATSIITPSSPFFNSDLKPIPFDLSKAKMLLRPDKMQQKYVLKTSSNPSAIDNGRVIIQQLKGLGLNIKLQSFEWGTFYDDVKKGNFQMATMRWVGIFDPDIYRIALHSKEIPPGRNRGHYINKKLDKLLEEGLSIENTQKRIKHYKAVQKIVFEDLPIIPLWYDTEIAIVNKRVKGYSPWRNGSFSSIINCSKK